MPTVYRTMKRAEDGLPVVGSNSKELGVRVPPTPHADVDVDSAGLVVVNGKGMSVSEHWRYMLPHLIPKRLIPNSDDATGSNSLTCYKMGEGPFGAAVLNADLEVIVKPHAPHGALIAPGRSVSVEDFQRALAATRSQ